MRPIDMRIDNRMTMEILRMSGPIAIGALSSTMLNIVDTAMVGRLGNVALGAVGLGSFFTLVMILVFGSLNIGTQAITSRRLGEGRQKEFPRIAVNATILAFAIGSIISVAGYFLSPWIFSLLSDNAEIVRVGTPYLTIRFTGQFAMVPMITLSGFVFGMGRVRIHMVISILVNIMNIILNWFLIFGHWIFPRMEVRGAAIASVLSMVAGLIVFIIIIYFRIIRPIGLRHGKTIVSGSLMGRIVKISLPRAVQSLSLTGFIIFLSFTGRIGVAELAISNIIFKAFNFTFMMGMSIGTASATLAGRSLGEGKEMMAVRYGWHSAGIGAVVMGLVGTAFMFFPREIMSIFTDSLQTIEKGVLPFRVLGAFQFIDGIGIVLSRTLQGTGSTMFVMISEMICIWLVMIPLTWISVELLGGNLFLVWTSLYVYIACFATLMAWKFKEGGWKKVRV
ncbi:MAG: MATE family efflux transporter [Candidatus Krumholzibacteria bacterium]|nr:MATE family efflux transporter [Candidatus Krumholzibacteria bacterium]